MLIPDAVQTLSAAFSFGTVLQAVLGALLIFYRGHGSTIFKDGPRLVLLLFFLFAALWAQVEFVSLLLAKDMANICQLTILLSTIFDQLARVTIEQFFMWSIGGTKVTPGRLILQGALFLRLIGGVMLVSFTKSQFAPVCVARISLQQTPLTPVSIAVLALDAIIVGVLLIREISGKSPDPMQKKSKALIFSIVGLGVWTVTSVPMILGTPATVVLTQTVLPANGLLVLVSIVTMFLGALTLAREENAVTPEARSPFVNPMPPPGEIFHGNPGGNGSPVLTHNYTKSGNLFIVNPSATPNGSPMVFQNSSRGDTRGFTKLGNEVDVQEIGEALERPDRLYRGSTGVIPAMVAASQAATQVSMAPPLRPTFPERSLTTPVFSTSSPVQKRSMFNWSKTPAKPSIRSLGISQPVPHPSDGHQSAAKIPTIDLTTAADLDRKRREEASARSKLFASRPQFSTREALAPSSKGKPNPVPGNPMMVLPVVVPSLTATHVATDGTTTSASISPGREEVRRRSPRKTNSFDPASEENAPKSSMQRKNNNGLPPNSKASSITMVQEVSIAKPQTVMFINDIVYDNPGMVNTIINASAPNSKIIASVRTGPLKSSDSIIHRPRPPYKRNTSCSNRALFPSEQSLGHVRSKSVSAIPRMSDFLSLSGSPTQLPALPAPPNTRAAYLKRLLPSDTESMSLDEKIEFLFPATPGPGTARRRRSSVPSLPRVPSMYLSEETRLQSPTEEQQLTQKAFEGTMIAPGIPLKSLKRQTIKSPRSEDQDFPVSTDLYKTIAHEVGEIWNPASHEGSIGDASTYWESIQSEVSPVDLSRARENGGSPYRQRPDSMRELPPLSHQELREDEAIVPMMLDSEENRRSFVMSAADNYRPSSLLSADQLSFVDRTHDSIKHGFGWHHRIGDDLPTFSERSRSNFVKRQMPPPPPLLLHRSGRRATVVVHSAEPSPQIDSPERAIAAIQEQLRRFEQQKSRGSVASLLRRIPGPNSENERGQDTGRFRLLETLEKEMGQQENQWQRMQSNLGRDSISISPYAQAEAENSTSQKTTQGSPNTPSMASSIRARFRSSTTVRLKSDGSNLTTLTAISENSRASIWQQRLAEAQMEYIENAPDLLRKSLNFLSVTKGKPSFVSSTPPDSGESETELETDFESDSDTEAMKQYQPPRKVFKEAVTLWRPSTISPEEATGHMWSSPYGTSSTSEATSEPPAKNMRPAQRLFEHVLPIFSTELWIESSSLGYSRPVVGLWGSKTVSQTGISTRPARQRPQRKSKRMTFLPDIVESPLPILNKRDTLGIFQFSSGELSDQPILTSDPALLKRPVLPALASKFDTRSRQLEPEKSEYSSSLFDEYEEEDSDLNHAASDDEFDESTLWEIADLLNSPDAPSQASLLPARRDQAIQDYDDFPETQGSEPVSPILSRLPIQPPAFATRATAQLWAGRVYGFNKPAAAGLPQPESAIWNALVALADDVVRVRPRSSQALPVLSSMELWVAPAAQAPTAPASSMWSNAKTEKSSGLVTSFPTTLMWSQPTTHEETIIPGLFNASILRSNYRSSDTIPAVISMVSKPRKSLAPLSILTPTSTRLWSGDERQGVEVDWISISSTRPESPSVYSTASSGTTSPVSDAFSARSSSTNASSTWSADTSTLALKWGSADKSPVNTSKDDSKHPSRIPVRQPPQQNLASVRESSVLSSRDLWESRAPAPEKTAVVRKFRRASTTQPNALSALKLKLQRKRMVYSPAEWEKSLAEAIAAGLPINISCPPPVAGTSDWEAALAEVTSEEATPRLRRPAAMKSDWETALSRAVFKSSSPMTYSPEKWEAALLEAINAGTVTIPNVAKIHPATVRRSLPMPGLWTSSVIASIPTSTAMWSKTTVPLRAVAVEMNLVAAAPRKASATIIFELPMLKSQSLWTPLHAAKENKDWLGLTARKPTFAQTWTPRAMPGGAEKIESLWTTKTVSAPPMPDMFAHVKRSHFKPASNPSRPSPLPRLDSVQLFALDSTAPTENSTHWLHKTSVDTSVAVAPKVLNRSMTWTARASEPSIKQQCSMWQARPTTTHASPDLFQNIPSESWSRTKRDFEAFMPIKSTELWQPPMEMPVSVKNWIVN
ncbi:uncharacterized protein L3040_003159 [Drepanopeziza brunnea f. sp. 'multigermtubi']|uniref:Uncharacterized protein n=1 Tax=Marssonina brunnea f. sp. multigermtubi (strain MB_m1) TaxID=1072389 RepID=K1WGT8_MARBU|nr:uncharacterized protein MBM_09795 [Drepanopeziza brunnea f. sp. 'multigermtubi' MB_m1]EKD12061.1 hypothetical protein MBM_09795 [Drepanopeziza brunnea f. sp. 'multigermtubi' MB_m1]KAJ5047332.1 hypothetical protein L3040_003159 [Drepanopeziza brunnea f. sp. 'multigermtubi']